MRGFSLRRRIRAVRFGIGALAAFVFLASGTSLSGLTLHHGGPDATAPRSGVGVLAKAAPAHTAHLSHNGCCGLLCSPALPPGTVALVVPIAERPSPSEVLIDEGVDPDGIRRPPKRA